MFFAIICLIAFFARYAGRECQSMDYVYFFKPWFDQMKEAGGLPSLKEQIGNYSLLYQTIIAFMTYIDIECIYQYKILNVIFDYGCALVIAELVAAAVGLPVGKGIEHAFAVPIKRAVPAAGLIAKRTGAADLHGKHGRRIRSIADDQTITRC